jgi:hypothetical protein
MKNSLRLFEYQSGISASTISKTCANHCAVIAFIAALYW